ncbi:hypothetical protein KJB16_002344 [Salmonella enterica]|nr:hypothetical protein [Salmonella enterica]EHN5666325.1 hypothetical protein [Salmonella enterica]
MLDGKLDKLHCGAVCFVVYGEDETIIDFTEYLRKSAHMPHEVRVIAGRDHLGRLKIALTGKIVEQLSFEAFRCQFLDDYNSR